MHYSQVQKRTGILKISTIITKWIKSIEFYDEIATIAASILINLKKRNQVIDYRDIFIAATAKHYHLTLATLNIDHFQRIEGITLLDIPEKS
jgi:predicted nucleic acid-binding protein